MIKKAFATAALLLVASFNSHAETFNDCKGVKSENLCACYTERAEYYRDRLRNGYTVSEYDFLESRLKYFRDKAFNCKSR